MVTNAEEKESPPRQERLRSAIAGHPQGAIRRIVLYCAMFAGMGLSYWVPPLIVVAIVAGILLVSTDQLL